MKRVGKTTAGVSEKVVMDDGVRVCMTARVMRETTDEKATAVCHRKQVPLYTVCAGREREKNIRVQRED